MQYSVFFHALCPTGRSLLRCFVYFHSEGVLLVASHVCVTHEVEDVLVGAGSRGREIQFHFLFRLQGQPLD